MDIFLTVLVIVLVTIIIYFAVKLKQLSDNQKITSSPKVDIETEVEKRLELELQKLELQKPVQKDLSEEEKEKIKWEIQKEVKAEEEIIRKRLLDLQEKIEEKEGKIELKLDEIEQRREKIEETKEKLKEIKDNLLKKQDELNLKEDQIEQKIIQELEKISSLNKEEAKVRILETAKKEMGNELLVWQQKYINNVEDEANLKAKEIVALAIQRCSSEVANEFTLTTIKLLDDKQKGQIIGKGGRNIQWLEKTLGVELIIDESPEVITISGFSSVRRHIAKRTIEMLLEDGRIHPASIEEYYQKAKAQIAQDIAEAGQWAMNQLGIIDFPAKLIRIIGRLKFRTSYGQNMLKHSVEMAKLAGLLAGEMNARFTDRQNPVDIEICVKGALLHDIGKAVDEESQPKGNHIELGEKVCDMFNLDWRIRKCVSSHHDESYYDEENGFCIEAALVDACDNISGGRPGARKESAEAYFERMESLEKIAERTPGITKSWIMRGSRELWIFFDTNKVNPDQMHTMTRNIAKEIENSIKYPGEIKVVGLWEDKIVEYAH
jgi:ribonucrease Y